MSRPAWANALLARHACALTFLLEPAAPVGFGSQAALAGVHLLGLAAVWRYYHQPIGYALPTLAVLLVLPAIAYRTRRALALETLAPFLFLYGLVAVRFVFVRAFGGTVPGYFDYNPPDLAFALFRIEPWTVCACLYVVALQVRLIAANFWPRVLQFVAGMLIAGALTWAASVYVGQRTDGVTGSDPYAYVQMGVDLATRGTPLHRFGLLESIVPLGVSWSPIVPTGYHVPVDSLGDSPTVWPFGGSIAFAAAYALAGEPALYLVNPLASLLLLAATAWLALELFAHERSRLWIAAASVAVLATSHTLFDWATVTMVDSQAALWSTLAIVFALRYRSRPRLLWAVLAGLTLGLAYFVRHTQLLLAPAILVLIWAAATMPAARWRSIAAFAGAALFAALPDLWYHQAVFGGVLHVESTELNLYSLGAVGATANAIAAQLLAAREFGWLLPFFLYGLYRLARARRVEFTAIVAWLLVLAAFHLPYPALRPRDLLPEFAPVVVLIGYGIVAFVGALSGVAGTRPRLLAGGGILITLFVFVMRVWNVFPQPWQVPRPSFGYVDAAERESFSRLESLTPPGAVIGASLNAGPIALYARRDSFQPALWSSSERDRFLQAMFRAGRAAYVLNDGADVSAAIRDLNGRYALRRLANLEVPQYGIADDETGSLWMVAPSGDVTQPLGNQTDN